MVKHGIKFQWLFYALAILFASLFIYAQFSKAWLTNNKDLDGNGIAAQVVVSPNLVIAKNNGFTDETGTRMKDITKATIASNLSLSWPDNSDRFIPATHDWTVGTVNGLKYNTNPEDVDDTTGYAKDNEVPLEFAACPNTASDGRYFMDYVVYVASVATQMKNVNLKATISSASEITNAAYNAGTIDFYVANVTDGNTITATSSNYKGSLTLADTTDELTLLSDTTVPVNTSGSIAILMRCYFDGAAEQTTGKAYVNTKVLLMDTSKAIFGVSIVAE